MKITLTDNDLNVSVQVGSRRIDVPKDAIETLAGALLDFNTDNTPED